LDYKLKETIVIDDIVPELYQERYHDIVLNTNQWLFIRDMEYNQVSNKFPSYGFNMVFKHPELGVVSELYEQICVPIIEFVKHKTQLGIEDIIYTRAFLQVPLEKTFVKPNNGIHVDLPTDHYACVYYLNDSDGDTVLYEQTRYNTQYGSNVKLKEHKRVKPKRGRLVMFDGARFHCSTQPKNKYRAIINFDLLMKE
jgi:hypothetical protein